MEALLSKFELEDINALNTDPSLEVLAQDYDFGNVNFEDKFNALADKKSKFIKNISSLENILGKISSFDEFFCTEKFAHELSQAYIGDMDQTEPAADLANIVNPKDIERLLTDQITPEWLALAFKILDNKDSASLIHQTLKNIILEKCKKILILTIKTLKTTETQIQAIHKKLLPISAITRIINEYEPLQYKQFLDIYIGCIHWYYKFYTSVYIETLEVCKVETVATVQEQATSYISKFLLTASPETVGADVYDRYEDHANFVNRLESFKKTAAHVVPLQILESSNAVFKIEDILKNFGLLLQENYKEETRFVKLFFNVDEEPKKIEVFDDRFLFETCQGVFKNFIEYIELDYLGILILIRLFQGYADDLEEGCDLKKFWQELIHLQLWPKFQKITSLRIYQMDFLKSCDILKFYDFMKNLLFVDLYLNQKFEWNSEPIYQSFINGLNLFEKINKNLKSEKGKQHWRILMFNLLDELDLKLRNQDTELQVNNIISELRQRYEV